MAGEDVSEASKTPDDSLEGWLDEKAEELGLTCEELLARLQNGDGSDGARADDSDRGAADDPDGAIEDDFGALRQEFADHLTEAQAEFESELTAVEREFESELSAVEREFEEMIEDVRERVVQVKRETDGKAPADHGHDDLRQRADQVADRADRLAEELEALSDTVAELDERVEAGFENYEDVLEYLTDTTDDLDAKLTTLAEVAMELRDRTQTLSARHASQAAADELAHLANRRGIERAKCSHCGETVHIGLLAEPNCPHCASTFNDVEPKQGLFGSARLVVGDQPALEGERADWDVASVMDADAADLSEALDRIIAEDDE
jgi:predicted  nucleic acid-binding Zn-ribbon protein